MKMSLLVPLRGASRFRQLIGRNNGFISLVDSTKSESKLQNNFKTCQSCGHFHTSSRRFALKEFFDNEKNWQEKKVLVGRPWKLDELRIKSNEDLHKLWYVLLKERNMLMTMEEEYKQMCEPLPNPERLDKVDESMRNLLEVVKERDVAYNLLETGDTGQPKVRWVRNTLGIMYPRTEEEHAVPKEQNKEYRLLHSEMEPWMEEYHEQYDEKLRLDHEKNVRADNYIKNRLKKEFPHLTEEELELGLEQHKERNEHNDL